MKQPSLIVKNRTPNPENLRQLEQSDVHPLLARLFASRGVNHACELDTRLTQLLPPGSLHGLEDASDLIIQAIEQDLRICIVADYDCDGASACALGVRGLRLLGAKHVNYLVPDRVVDGYGLTPEISRRVRAMGADLLITVDNGIASVEGVRVAKELGMKVLITDHHLPASMLPSADAIVNPNQPNCSFKSKNLSGVGVIFYVLLGTRAKMRAMGKFADTQAPPLKPGLAQPKLDSLLPLVALGSVADVVRLDANNRCLVDQGLKRIQSRQMPIGMQCLFEVAAKDPQKANTQDLGFSIGPRINAAGRLSDMTIGIECLLSDHYDKAIELAKELHQINMDRRSVEASMLEEAWSIASRKSLTQDKPSSAICVHDDQFHEGVVGIVASRIKELYHCPTFVFAPSHQADSHAQRAILKGSGRSVAGFHLKDALDLISKRHPEILVKFGGHAMAAGCTIYANDFHAFESALSQVAHEWLGEYAGQKEVLCDGSLEPENLSIECAQMLQEQVWGQGFEVPLFFDKAHILKQRIVGEKHLALRVRVHNREIDAIVFNRTQSLDSPAQLLYKLDVDTWGGSRKLKLIVDAAFDDPRA
jgi:single-stranded-DNA-specific exonuclease